MISMSPIRVLMPALTTEDEQELARVSLYWRNRYEELYDRTEGYLRGVVSRKALWAALYDEDAE